MRFLIRFAHDGKYSPAVKRDLSKVAYGAVKGLGADVGNLRVGSSAVELDLLIESESGLEDAKQLLQEKLGPILTIKKLDEQGIIVEKGEAIRQGLSLFNEERYWESHEALEAAWRVAENPEKEVLQGIILIAAALVHLQKNEPEITLSIMNRAVSKLQTHRGVFFGVAVESVLEEVHKMITESRPHYFKIEANLQPNH